MGYLFALDADMPATSPSDVLSTGTLFGSFRSVREAHRLLDAAGTNAAAVEWKHVDMLEPGRWHDLPLPEDDNFVHINLAEVPIGGPDSGLTSNGDIFVSILPPPFQDRGFAVIAPYTKGLSLSSRMPDDCATTLTTSCDELCRAIRDRRIYGGTFIAKGNDRGWSLQNWACGQ